MYLIVAQVCPDGRPKVVDIVDCTGSGDVDTSTVIKGDAVNIVEGIRQIKGLSGRYFIIYIFVFFIRSFIYIFLFFVKLGRLNGSYRRIGGVKRARKP